MKEYDENDATPPDIIEKNSVINVRHQEAIHAEQPRKTSGPYPDIDLDRLDLRECGLSEKLCANPAEMPFFPRLLTTKRSNFIANSLPPFAVSPLSKSQGVKGLDNWDSMPIASNGSGTKTSSMGATTFRGFPEEAASIRTENDESGRLHTKDLQIMEENIFERNTRHSLQGFVKVVRDESNQKSQGNMGATKFILVNEAQGTRPTWKQFVGDEAEGQKKAFHDTKHQNIGKIILESSLVGCGLWDGPKKFKMTSRIICAAIGNVAPKRRTAQRVFQRVKGFEKLKESLLSAPNAAEVPIEVVVENKVSSNHEMGKEKSSENMVPSVLDAITATQTQSWKKGTFPSSNDTMSDNSSPSEASTNPNSDAPTSQLAELFSGELEDDTPDSPLMRSSSTLPDDDKTIQKSSLASHSDSQQQSMFNMPIDLEGIRSSMVTEGAKDIPLDSPSHSKPIHRNSKLRIQSRGVSGNVSFNTTEHYLTENSTSSVPPVDEQHEHKSGAASATSHPLVMENTKARLVTPGTRFALIQNIRNMAKRLLRPVLPDDQQRVVWTCKCGDELYVDLSIHSKAEATRLSAMLQCVVPHSGPHLSYPQESVVAFQASSSLSLSGIAPASSSQLVNSSPALTPEDSSSGLVSSCHPAPKQAYLEICVDTGKFTKTLGEIDLRGVGCDGELFKRIRVAYSQLQSFKSKILFMRPVAIHFVKFTVQDPLLVGILQKPLSIPPPHEVDAENYVYEPCPLQDGPPMPAEIFLHYLSCDSLGASWAWLPRLPKKLNISILRFAGAMNQGWGVHIKEGPNWTMIFVLNVALIALSGLAAFLWDFYEHDFQGAFGFAAWIFMVVNSALVTYIVEHSPW